MKLTPEKLTAFCAALSETAQVSKACSAVGIARQTAYQWRRQNLDFALAWDEAMQVAVSALEDEAIRRGHEGFDEPLVHQGQFTPVVDFDAIDPLTNEKFIPQLAPVKRNADGSPQYATMKKYSDTLLIFTLKAHAPQKYRENTSIELTGKGGGAVQFNDTEKAARIAALVALAQKRAVEAPLTESDVSDLI
ncbi:terminase [Herbaspirillum sp. RTI4]|uniref:terminase n=1 Tax=Herbaspirillum sp. RTI4 TaxID=3048640 RepID=UPI002AB592EF|nr:terminase [Herbaspirillum sp. RTI4]MDY7579367.1 terminase [Herbaspirillum sp. RTI4]MEA9980281.1 terminase [Herbaspirillum sp. RTI4]